MNPHLKGSLLIAGSMMFYALIGPFVRWLELPVAILMIYVSLFVAVIYSWYFLIKKDLGMSEMRGISEHAQKSLIFDKLKLKKMWFLVVLSALFVVINSFTYLKAYSITTFANTVFTHYTAPIFALIAAVFYLREKLEKISVIAIIISTIGLLFIAYKELNFTSSHLLGIFFGVLSGFGYGVLININKKIVGNVAISTIMFYQALIPMLVLSPNIFLAEYSLNFNKIILLLVYSIFLFIIPTIMYLKGIKHVKAQHAGIIAYTEPIFVVLFGFLFFRETPSANTLIGGLLILFSGYLIIRKGASRR